MDMDAEGFDYPGGPQSRLGDTLLVPGWSGENDAFGGL